MRRAYKRNIPKIWPTKKTYRERHDYLVELGRRIHLELPDRSLTKFKFMQLLQYELYSRILADAEFQEELLSENPH